MRHLLPDLFNPRLGVLQCPACGWHLCCVWAWTDTLPCLSLVIQSERLAKDVETLALPDGATIVSAAAGHQRFTLRFDTHDSRWHEVPVEFDFRVPMTFPGVPPTVQCKTAGMHEMLRSYMESISTVTDGDAVETDTIEEGGRVALSLLKFEGGGWASEYTLSDIVFAVQQLLAVPGRAVTGHIKCDSPIRSAGTVRTEWGECGLQGRRPTMEDEVACHPTLDAGTNPAAPGGTVGYFAVYDGHGGDAAARHFSSSLHAAVSARLRGGAPPAEALFNAFIAADEEYLKRLSSMGSRSEAGTTAVVALIAGSSLFVANCGDSRAVLSRAGTALSLTSDHKAARPDEVARICRAGGFVVRNRVLGSLAVSRALGDPSFKSSGTPRASKPALVSPEPQMVATTLSTKDEFVVLGCDGLFDVMESQAVVDLAREELAGGSSPKAAARRLAETALSKGSADNVSVVVVALGDGVTRGAQSRRTLQAPQAAVGTGGAGGAVRARPSSGGGRALAAGLLSAVDSDSEDDSPARKRVPDITTPGAMEDDPLPETVQRTNGGDIFVGTGSATKKDDVNPFSRNFGGTRAGAKQRRQLVGKLRPTWSARDLTTRELKGDEDLNRPPGAELRHSHSLDKEGGARGHMRSISSPAAPSGVSNGGAGHKRSARLSDVTDDDDDDVTPLRRPDLPRVGSGASSGSPGGVLGDTELMDFLMDDANFDGAAEPRDGDKR